MGKEKLLELKNITLSYDQDCILDHINLYIKDKEFVTLLGPSGCGKTTTLRIIGGFTAPDEGDVFFEGKRINDRAAAQAQAEYGFPALCAVSASKRI